MNYYTTKEVAERINRSTVTVHKYVQEGKLKPVEDIWGGHHGLLFEKAHIDAFIANMPDEKPGYTLSEAAKTLETNRTTIQSYLNEGLLPYIKHQSRGRTVTFIKENDLKEFSEIYEKRIREDRLKQRQFYNRKRKEAVYQLFSSPSLPEARLFRKGLGEWHFIIPQTGKELSYNEGIYQYQLSPVYPVEFGKRIGTPGYAKINLPLRYSLTYQFIDLLYQDAFVVNMYMDILQDRMIILMKDHVFYNASEELAEFISSRLEEGKSYYKQGILAIESEQDTLSIRLSREIKQWIKQLSNEKGTSMQDIAREIIEEKYRSIHSHSI
ncbi:helix-turn-helix domain-containing protein [Pseudobacillus sp. 179-B 2D1 NHS]|uniref:helix-turn-helix domain-containing protein n=1 Tax=Pseudobacillus sp. 179-B 2D1 NHS TaxID=3374292 RepID=UPI00387999E8